MLKKVLFALVPCLLASLAFAQNHKLDVGLNYAGFFTSQAEGNGITLKPTQAGSFLANVRYRFSPKHSIEFNLGRATQTEHYNTPPFSYDIPSKITELGGAYVFSPIETEKYEPFFLIGLSAMRYYPRGTTTVGGTIYTLGRTQTELAYVYGAGLDYHLYKRFAVRLQYRGLINSAPTFGLGNLFTGSRLHTAEPSVGLVIKF